MKKSESFADRQKDRWIKKTDRQTERYTDISKREKVGKSDWFVGS